MQLLGNALKFSSAQPQFVISAQENEAEYVIAVRDNGVGFNMRQKDRLFKIFQRLHSQREYEGTGVGLALVRRIVSRHGGRIWAEGKEGAGACFWVALPKQPAVTS